MTEFDPSTWTEVGTEAAAAAAKAAEEAGSFFQFSAVGDKVAGKLLAIKEDVKGNFGPEFHLKLSSPALGNFTVRANKDLRERVVGALAAGQAKIGDIVGIIYAKDKDIGKQSPMKIFKFVVPGAKAAPAKPAADLPF